MTQLQKEQAWAKSSQWVAVVDDDAQIAQALELLLSLKGVRASAHASAESLLSCLTVQQGRWLLQTADGETGALAAAVLDLNLPGMTGVDLSLHLREVQPDLKVVMITAALNDVLEQRGDDLKGVTCLSKPFDLESLEKALFGD